jgi:hypothetical protein
MKKIKSWETKNIEENPLIGVTKKETVEHIIS